MTTPVAQQAHHLHLRKAPSAKTSIRRVQVLDFGQLEIDSSVMWFGPLQASINDQHRPAEWVSVPLYAVLIETDNARILFDTGTHPDSATRWSPGLQPFEYLVATEEQHLPRRLDEIGLTPEDIDIAILSHLHMDHSGGVEYLTNADVMAHRDEFRNALDHFARVDGSPAYVKADVAGWIEKKIHWDLVERDDDEIPVVPGVKIVNFGAAHTEGDLGLILELPVSGTVVLTGDACYTARNLGPPPLLPGSTAFVDSRGMLRAARRLERFRQSGAELWFTHDPDQYRTFAKAPHGFYE